MGALSNISWTDHTFNPWIGCTKVSPGCAHCYAAQQDAAKRWTPEGWGPGKPRRLTADSTWRLPVRWNLGEVCLSCGTRQRGRLGRPDDCGCGALAKGGRTRRQRVFCASLADWLDEEVPVEWLRRLLGLIKETPNLNWQLLTKRPQNFRARLTAAADLEDDSLSEWINWWVVGRSAKENVWVGASVENDDAGCYRIPALLSIPAKVRFLSCEPLLGPITLPQSVTGETLHWLIVGGESGSGHRKMEMPWLQHLVYRALVGGTRVFVKQDCGQYPGRQGSISNELWNTKQFPSC